MVFFSVVLFFSGQTQYFIIFNSSNTTGPLVWLLTFSLKQILHANTPRAVDNSVLTQTYLLIPE